MEEPGRLQSMGSLWVGHDWATSLSLSLCTFTHWRRKWQPTPVFLLGESYGQRSLAGCGSRGHKELDTTEQLTLPSCCHVASVGLPGLFWVDPHLLGRVADAEHGYDFCWVLLGLEGRGPCWLDPSTTIARELKPSRVGSKVKRAHAWRGTKNSHPDTWQNFQFLPQISLKPPLDLVCGDPSYIGIFFLLRFSWLTIFC